MGRSRSACTAWLATMLAACGAPQEQSTEPAAAKPAQETVFDEMVGTMDEARKVEEISAERKQQLDQSLEQAEGSR